MPRRVFVHVGCPKTGTSYLQSILWHNKRLLRKHGLLVPVQFHHHFATAMAVRSTPRYASNARLRRHYEGLRSGLARFDGDVVVTHELLAPATQAQAGAFLESLPAEEVHVVVTARDLARQLPAEWQQHVKSGWTGTLPEFVADVRGRSGSGRWFWAVQDPADVAARWGATLPAERVHVVTVPPRGSAEPDTLWHRFASVLGVPEGLCDLNTERRNESLGAVEVELVRQANAWQREHGGVTDYRALMQRLSTGVLAGRPGARKFGYDPGIQPWLVEEGRAIVERLRGSGYDVVGDLEDLVPAAEAEPGADPADVTQDEVLHVAFAALLDSAARLRDAERVQEDLRGELARTRRQQRKAVTRRQEYERALAETRRALAETRAALEQAQLQSPVRRARRLAGRARAAVRRRRGRA